MSADAQPQDKTDRFFLAQYEKLRDEIVARNNYIMQIVQITLIAFGTISGVAFVNNGIREIILGYIVLALLLAILYMANNIAIRGIGEYIRKRVEKNIIPEKNEKSENIPWWEHSVGSGILKGYNRWLSFAAFILFVGTQLISIIVYYVFLKSSEKTSLSSLQQNNTKWIVGIVIAITVILLVCFDIVPAIREKSKIGKF